MLRLCLLSSVCVSLRTSRLSANPAALNIIRGMAEGATGSGSSRAGGIASGDAFSKREKANEDYYVREQEKAKLLALREKLKQQQKHLQELDKHIDELTKGQGGEQN
ncbi:MAG: hypothetical protein M1829_002773 [Trizodia sp. TS-e1964]|nr:MAG: hypothetical protein M1829_002773 [Trizodia sp. TS-e1964]